MLLLLGGIASTTRRNATDATTMSTTDGVNLTNLLVNLTALAICKIIVASLLLLFTATGNALVCVAILLEKRLQTTTNYFLISLAMADLMVALLVMPFGILVFFTGDGTFPLPMEYCTVYLALGSLFCDCSVIHLTTLSVDRYLSLRYPIVYGRNKTKRRVLLKICLVWTTAAITAIILMMPTGQSDNRQLIARRVCNICEQNRVRLMVNMVLSFYVPALIMIAVHFLTMRLLRQLGVKKSLRVLSIRHHIENTTSVYRPTDTTPISSVWDIESSLCVKSIKQAAIETGATAEIEAMPAARSQATTTTTTTTATTTTTTTTTTTDEMPIRSTDVATADAITPTRSTATATAATTVAIQTGATSTTSETPVTMETPATIEATQTEILRAARRRRKSSAIMGSGATLRIRSQLQTAMTARADLASAAADAETVAAADAETTTATPMTMAETAKATAASASAKTTTTAMATTTTTIVTGGKRKTVDFKSQQLGRNSCATSTRGRYHKSERRATKVLNVIFFTFFVLWTPYVIFSLTIIVCPQCAPKISLATFDVALWLGLASSAANPVIYTVFNPTFRQTFAKLLHVNGG